MAGEQNEAAESDLALKSLAVDARAVLRAISQTDVRELVLEREGRTIRLRRSSELAAMPAETGGAAEPEIEVSIHSEIVDESTLVVKSPVVGWLRLSAQPNGLDPLVEVGQRVEAGQPLAVIEAVQIVHEVKAELAGTVLEVLAVDGQGVEFGQPLFRLQLDP